MTASKAVKFKEGAELEAVRNIEPNLKPGVTPKKPGRQKKDASQQRPVTPTTSKFKGFGKRGKDPTDDGVSPKTEEASSSNPPETCSKGPVSINDSTIVGLLEKYKSADVDNKEVFAFNETILKNYPIFAKSDEIFAAFVEYTRDITQNEQLFTRVANFVLSSFWSVEYFSAEQRKDGEVQLKAEPKTVSSQAARLHTLLQCLRDVNQKSLMVLMMALKKPFEPTVSYHNYCHHLLHASCNELGDKRREIMFRLVDVLTSLECQLSTNTCHVDNIMHILLSQIMQTTSYHPSVTPLSYPDGDLRDESVRINVSEAKKMFSVYCRVLENMLLKLPKVMISPFLVVVASSLDDSLFEHVIAILWRVFDKEGNVTAVMWLGCLLSRVNFVPTPLAKEVLRYLSVWLIKIVDHGCKNCSGLKLLQFLNAVQALLMIFNAHHEALSATVSDCAFLKTLRFGKILTCRLKPLLQIAHCVADEFLQTCDSLDHIPVVSSVPALRLTMKPLKSSGTKQKQETVHLKPYKLFTKYDLEQSKWAVLPLLRRGSDERRPVQRKRRFSEVEGGDHTDEECEVYKMHLDHSVVDTDATDDEHFEHHV